MGEALITRRGGGGPDIEFMETITHNQFLNEAGAGTESVDTLNLSNGKSQTLSYIIGRKSSSNATSGNNTFYSMDWCAIMLACPVGSTTNPDKWVICTVIKENETKTFVPMTGLTVTLSLEPREVASSVRTNYAIVMEYTNNSGATLKIPQYPMAYMWKGNYTK